MSVAVAHQVSDTSRIALSHAVREAVLRSTDLVVLHVVESLDADKAEAYRLGISDEIAKVASQAPGLACEVLRTSGGDVSRTLLSLVDQVRPELLVIGARRRSPVGKALMGSVAQTLILEVHVPVLVVKTS